MLRRAGGACQHIRKPQLVGRGSFKYSSASISVRCVVASVIALALGTIHVLNKRQAAKGSDAGKGLV